MKTEKKEFYSDAVSAGKRTYFFDLRHTAEDDIYLTISESRPISGKGFEHSRVMVFEENILPFFEGLKRAIDFLKLDTKPKAYNVQHIRTEHLQAYAKWTQDEDTRLKLAVSQGKTLDELSIMFQRKSSAIRSRLLKLGLP